MLFKSQQQYYQGGASDYSSQVSAAAAMGDYSAQLAAAAYAFDPNSWYSPAVQAASAYNMYYQNPAWAAAAMQQQGRSNLRKLLTKLNKFKV